jgi:hypothetical protein
VTKLCCLDSVCLSSLTALCLFDVLALLSCLRWCKMVLLCSVNESYACFAFLFFFFLFSFPFRFIGSLLSSHCVSRVQNASSSSRLVLFGVGPTLPRSTNHISSGIYGFPSDHEQRLHHCLAIPWKGIIMLCSWGIYFFKKLF